MENQLGYESRQQSENDPLYTLSSENNRLESENIEMKRTVNFLTTELDKHRQPPFIVTEILSISENNQVVIRLPNQNNFLVNVSEECEKLKVGDMVLNDQKSLVVLRKINLTKNFPVENYVILNGALKHSWKDIGGLDEECKKVKEVLELPLMKPGLFKEIGITPPKGILLHGPPGTGKTMIAKALAKETKATFIELVGSELVQKFIGEGAKLVKELFQMAREKAPTIIFIDEIDSIASKRVETGTSGEREVHRTFMQLLGEIDGFDALDNVKIIAATNRIDILDDAILRPGRLERHIEVGSPDEKGRLDILKIHTKTVKLEKSAKLNIIAEMTPNFTGAKLKSLITEAGYIAINDNRTTLKQSDLKTAAEKITTKETIYEPLSGTFN